MAEKKEQELTEEEKKQLEEAEAAKKRQEEKLKQLKKEKYIEMLSIGMNAEGRRLLPGVIYPVGKLISAEEAEELVKGNFARVSNRTDYGKQEARKRRKKKE